MRLTEIDGDLYVSDSLLAELEAQPDTRVDDPSPTFVYAGERVIGSLMGFTIGGGFLEVRCVCLIPPLELLSVPSGVPVRIDGAELVKGYTLKEISCDVQGSHCTLKSILRLPEVPNERER